MILNLSPPIVAESVHAPKNREGRLAMIKLVYCITKKAELTDQQFFDYWKNIHGPIGSRIPRLRKLVQSHRLTIPGDRRQPDRVSGFVLANPELEKVSGFGLANPEPKYDGMAELWFDDAEALLAARQSPEWQASHEDETNFIDHSRVAYFVSEEHIILDRLKP
jgi:uncharacterized protein (TIGR02118 family)